jgi:hypothetical protein
MSQYNFAHKYRPNRFQDVWGQEHAVRFLSGLIQRGKWRRNLSCMGRLAPARPRLFDSTPGP